MEEQPERSQRNKIVTMLTGTASAVAVIEQGEALCAVECFFLCVGCFMAELWRSFCDAASESPRIYFAPLRGVICALREEWIRLDSQRS